LSTSPLESTTRDDGVGAALAVVFLYRWVPSLAVFFFISFMPHCLLAIMESQDHSWVTASHRYPRTSPSKDASATLPTTGCSGEPPPLRICLDDAPPLPSARYAAGMTPCHHFRRRQPRHRTGPERGDSTLDRHIARRSAWAPGPLWPLGPASSSRPQAGFSPLLFILLTFLIFFI
jgi:hypothetical protein